VARFLEDNGFATVVLTMTPEFHREIGIPRVAAIEYPYGRTVGEVNDVEGQRQVLLQALDFLASADTPGAVRHLPFTWPEEPKHTKWQPPEISPIIKLHLDDIKAMGARAKRS
jgi:hypothetical protein